jgi:ankyrin repeat protein
MKILGNTFEPRRLVGFQTIFSDSECLEDLVSTRIHKIVLALNSGNLQELLDSEQAPDVNEADFEGRTPLSSAAQRGDTPALLVLLHHGADPNLATRKRATPFHHAVEAQTPSCISPLIEHRADARVVDHGLRTPLHFACKHRGDEAYVAPLITAAAGIYARADYDYTPLVDAAYKNHPAMALYLLKHGADIDRQAQYGKIPVVYTVEYNSHDVLRLLLARGADCTIQSRQRGSTIAHFAARHGDLEMLRILADARIKGSPIHDLEREDFEGLVVEEIVTNKIRYDFVEGFREAFQALIESLTPEDANELDDEAGVNKARKSGRRHQRSRWVGRKYKTGSEQGNSRLVRTLFPDFIVLSDFKAPRPICPCYRASMPRPLFLPPTSLPVFIDKSVSRHATGDLDTSYMTTSFL